VLGRAERGGAVLSIVEQRQRRSLKIQRDTPRLEVIQRSFLSLLSGIPSWGMRSPLCPFC
jgi:hypothetical protein